MPTDDLIRFCCQNSDCPRYGERGDDTLRDGFLWACGLPWLDEPMQALFVATLAAVDADRRPP